MKRDDLTKELICGKYRVLELLDMDLYGVFYEAENEFTGRKVVLRLIENKTPEDAEKIKEIAEKVRSLVTSRCDHLVQVLDMELPQDEKEPLVIVMESNFGEKFIDKVSEGTPFEASQAVRISMDVLVAVSAAHSKAVIPLSPAEEDVYLMQWAGRRRFAKILAPRAAPSDHEAGIGQDIGFAGVILWRGLTGAHPDACPDDKEGALKLLDALADVEEEFFPELPALADICVKALHRGYESPDQMLEDLEDTGLSPASEGEASVSFESLPQAAFSRPDELPDTQPTVVDRKQAHYEEYFPDKSEPAPIAATSRRSMGVVIGALFAGVLLGSALTFLLQSFFPGSTPGSRRAEKTERDEEKEEVEKTAVFGDRPPLKFGIAYYSKLPDFKEQMQKLSGYLEKRLKRPIHLTSLDHFEAGKRLEDGSLDLGVFSPLLYVLTKKEYPDISLLVTHLAFGSTTYEGYIVVSDTSPVRSIHDLRGETICFVSKTSGSGYLFPKDLMIREGLDPDKDFSSMIFTQSHRKSIDYVLSGKCAAAAVASIAYLDAVVKGAGAVRILPAVTDLIPGDAYCVSPKLDQSTVKQLERALLTFDPVRDLNMKYLGRLHRITGFDRVRDDHYDSIRRVLESVKYRSRQKILPESDSDG